MFGGHQIKNHLQKTGGVMTGDLDLGLNTLYLTDGVTGAALQGSPSTAHRLVIRQQDGTGYGAVSSGAFYPSDVIGMQPGKTVDGVDVSEINQAKIKTGNYTGNGADDRTIAIGIDLTAKTNVFIIVNSADVQWSPVYRAEQAQGDLSQMFDNTNESANKIQALVATGFQVGNDDKVNDNGTLFRYIIIYEEP